MSKKKQDRPFINPDEPLEETNDTTVQLAEPTFYQNGHAPIYMADRIKHFDKAGDERAVILWREWKVIED